MQLGPGRDQGELLVILPMFLYLKHDSQFFWEILWFHCSMGGCPNQLGERLLRLGLKLRSSKSLVIASTSPRIVAERELSSSVSFSIKHVTTCSNPGSLPQGSIM
jgi:hypothetical protein